MFTIDFSHPVHMHFIGIGGISMSGLATLLIKEGFSISGSDASESDLTRRLAESGARISIGQRAENITGDIDVVVVTAAIHEDNPELARAVELGLPILSRADLLGQIMQNYRVPIAVAGTHGKTTTTSMAAHVLLASGLDPTVSVGGMLPAIGGNFRVGSRDIILVEACEYKNSFHSFLPQIGIILNIEADHLDFFEDLADIRRSFRQFAKLIPADGTLVISADLDQLGEFTDGLSCRIITFSASGPADVTASALQFDDLGCVSFDADYRGQSLGHFRLRVPGEHNVENALATIAMGVALDLEPDAIAEGLSGFTGTDRRFQKKGEWNGVTIIDDYAHHPTEIRATLQAARKVPHRKLWCIFQPHTYTRTKALLAEFADALSCADAVILADIYEAREKDIYGISSADVCREVEKTGTEVLHLPSFAAIEDYVRATCTSGDLLITMGAGNVVEIGEHLLSGE